MDEGDFLLPPMAKKILMYLGSSSSIISIKLNKSNHVIRDLVSVQKENNTKKLFFLHIDFSEANKNKKHKYHQISSNPTLVISHCSTSNLSDDPRHPFQVLSILSAFGVDFDWPESNTNGFRGAPNKNGGLEKVTKRLHFIAMFGINSLNFWGVLG